jgi:hypothetical protein
MTLPSKQPWNLPQGGLTLPPKRVMCAIHGEPLRSQWPMGFAVFTMKVVTKALEDKDLSSQCQGKVERVNAALEVQPACMWVPEDTLLEAYREGGIGRMSRCEECGELSPGTPFQTQEKEYDHLCFFCVIENGKTHHLQLAKRERRRLARRAKRRRR